MDLKLVNDLLESRMYRSKQAFTQTNARQVADLAFMDMIAIWILFNEFEYAPTAMDYASRTVAFNRFTTFRNMGTDLYLNLHVITQKRTDLVGSDADAALLDRIQLDVMSIVRYLRMISNNGITKGFVRQTLQRLEHALHIEDSNYRSIRRLAQNWPDLATGQKRAVLTRMVFFYRKNAIRSEMFQAISSLATSKGLLDRTATDPEMNKGSKLRTAAAAAAAGVAATAGGYALGKRIGKSLV